MLTGALTFGTGLAIHDVNVDHTQEFCPLSYIPVVGAFHQGRAMLSDLRDKGYNIMKYTVDEKAEDGDSRLNNLMFQNVNVFYGYRPIPGFEDIPDYLNNYAGKITLER